MSTRIPAAIDVALPTNLNHVVGSLKYDPRCFDILDNGPPPTNAHLRLTGIDVERCLSSNAGRNRRTGVRRLFGTRDRSSERAWVACFDIVAIDTDSKLYPIFEQRPDVTDQSADIDVLNRWGGVSLRVECLAVLPQTGHEVPVEHVAVGLVVDEDAVLVDCLGVV